MFLKEQLKCDSHSSGTGIFAMCDEEINVPRGSDEGFLNKIIKKWRQSPEDKKAGKRTYFAQTTKKMQKTDSRNCFTIYHYAGPVHYNSKRFLEKNKDALHPDVEALLQESEWDFLKMLFPKSGASSGASSGVTRRGGR